MKKRNQKVCLLIFNLHSDYMDFIASDVWFDLYNSEHFGDIRHELMLDMLGIT